MKGRKPLRFGGAGFGPPDQSEHQTQSKQHGLTPLMCRALGAPDDAAISTHPDIYDDG